jgi:3-methyl-2-oxobutanoate hydroxymethyltransferase
MHKVTVRDVAEMKARGEKIPMITAYDYTTAKVVDQAGIPLLLVGDSLGMVVLGYESTVSVTMDDMLHHVKAVARGTKNSMVIADLPFMAYQLDPTQALANAGRLIQEGGASSVKLEGGERMAETTRRIVECGIPVMGHIGLTPQSVHGLSGYRVQGRGRDEAEQLLKDALALEQAGAYAIVLEMVPAPLACVISKKLTIPTIGIVAGAGCDGQVLVIHDMLGLFTDFVPKHARQYAQLANVMADALTRYAEDVKDGSFPSAKESFKMDEGVLEGLAAGS